MFACLRSSVLMLTLVALLSSGSTKADADTHKILGKSGPNRWAVGEGNGEQILTGANAAPLKVKIGDRVIDVSLKNKLEQLKNIVH